MAPGSVCISIPDAMRLNAAMSLPGENKSVSIEKIVKGLKKIGELSLGSGVYETHNQKINTSISCHPIGTEINGRVIRKYSSGIDIINEVVEFVRSLSIPGLEVCFNKVLPSPGR